MNETRMGTGQIDLWVVDDRSDLREAIAQCLHAQREICCTRQFASGEEVLAALSAGEVPHVILLDVNLAANSGLDFIEPIKRISPATRVLMFTTFSDSVVEFKAYQKGADGFLLKRQQVPEIVDAICEWRDRDDLFPNARAWRCAVSVPSVPARCRSRRGNFIQSLRTFLAL